MPLYVIATLLMIALDQIVKYWAFTSLKIQSSIPLIENVFHLTYVENRGAAFSLFAQFDSRWIFVSLAVGVTIAIFIVLRINYLQTGLGRWSLVLVAAGALGNAIDRVVHGFVVDLFDFRLINFPVFNVADIYVTCATILLVLVILFRFRDEDVGEILSSIRGKRKKESEPEEK